MNLRCKTCNQKVASRDAGKHLNEKHLPDLYEFWVEPS